MVNVPSRSYPFWFTSELNDRVLRVDYLILDEVLLEYSSRSCQEYRRVTGVEGRWWKGESTRQPET